MSLINCLNCGRKISEHAEACPNCGWVYTTEMRNMVNWFLAAKHEYHLAVEIIEKISGITQTINPSFSTEMAIRQLDYGIQEVLYLIATTNDGIIDIVEKDFLENIVEHGDIFRDNIVEISIQDTLKLSWGFVDKLKQPNNQQIIEIINTYVSPIVQDLIGCAAITQQFQNKLQNQVPSKSMLFELEEKILHIGIFMINASKKQDKNAINTGVVGTSVDMCEIIASSAVEMVFGKKRRAFESEKLF